ncbi:putative disease resistance protein RGA3 [Quercus robur]|uniref:putative disease resistance protein RGA3 n=1 Tax=Quercus robur TaxID=38942 RepID=UPI002162F1C7|nr:putative disease resistance protein RGA3 [Quercus robur]XP_050256213.1 putative disease resistance protein RGA3 [Quercus robur]XP_050256214.1 putative disease resistance protein RGA3 [Quercus robur]
MGRQRDQFWEHAKNENGRFKCNYCQQDFPGGASRIKAHLAGIPGHDIKACNAVPQDVQEKAQATQKKREAQVTQGTNKKLKSVSTSTSKSKTKTIKIVTQGKEEYRAEIILNDVVDRLIAKVSSLATEYIDFELSFKVELINLLETLFKIKFVLGDAQKRQSSDESMGIWLTELRNVAYDADNVLDEFSYESFWQKVRIQNQMMDQVRNFSLCNLDKVKTIKQLLDIIVNDVANSGLRMELVSSIPKISLDMNIDSLLDDSKVIGREYDIKKIVNLLISSSNQKDISVLPIMGMAGIGKTTLAKLVYNNELLKKHFDVLAWVNVGKNFDVEGILREILKSLGEDLGDCWGRKFFDKVLEICAKILWAKKYLLILDDVQNEDPKKWDTLKGYLLKFNSNTGNNIVITTCSDNVGQIMKIHPPHHLEKLSKDDCWSIMKKRTFIDGRIPLDLEVIGREIAKRCGGVPLTARVLGATMCFEFDKNKWLEIQNNKIWDLLDEDNSDIFLVLKLCFDLLPTPSLKRCFAYCAIFPKDYNMKKDEVIQYWMAEGFLLAKEANMEMEDIGNMYFNILLATSFFQNARKDAYGNIISCKMHNLVHDFALSISKFETLILEGDSVDNGSSIQPLFARLDGKSTLGSSFSEVDSTKLRTLISENFNFDIMLSNFKWLRVLKLFGDGIMKLSDSIEQLIHLSLLDISYSEIEVLPKSITKLYNLQTLRIEGFLHGLPEDLSNLINLRHIHINWDCYVKTPKNMSMLTCLQTLPFFGVGSEDGYRITELGALKNLKGEIVIKNLESVKDEEEAKSAKLKEKEIFNLGLYWDKGSDKDEKVLEGLHPHPNLKSLTIEYYGGKKFPSWVGLSSLYHNLIEINLRYCRECEEVPTLGQLPCLRVLEMEGMEKVRCIGSEFYFYSDGSYRNTTTILFPALRILKLVLMESLEEWKDAKELTTADEVLLVFPCLEELTLRSCYKLRDLPESLHTCVSLQKLVVQDCHKLRSLPGVPSIIRCGIEDLPSGLQCVEYLENGYCRLPSSSTSSIHPSLQKLKLKLYSLNSLLVLDQIQYFIALKILWIEGSYQMAALPEWLGNLSSLQWLCIVSCWNLVHLPTEETMRRLTQLKTLIIYECPKFEDNEQIKISHVPWVKINQEEPYCSDFKD